MNFLSYITENALILIPVIYIIGTMLKQTTIVKDKYIPLILLPIGVGLSMGVMGRISADAIIQGILVVGTTVYTNQLVVQSKKSE